VAPTSAPASALPLVAGEGAPASFDAERLKVAVMTYVADSQPQITTAPVGADPCAAARSLASTLQVPVAVWFGWSHDEARGPVMTMAALPAGSTCEAAATFAAPYDEQDAAYFYRVVALKLSSLLHELGTLPRPPPPQGAGPAPEPSLVPEVEMGLAATLAPDAAARLMLGEIGGNVVRGPWALGLRGFISAPRRHDEAQAFAWGAAAQARRSLVDITADVTLEAEAGVGLQGLWGGARAGESAERRTHQVVLPLVSMAFLAAVRWAPVTLRLGPSIDGSWGDVSLDAAGAPLLHSPWVRLRAEARLGVGL
jgi:hypothetical protein